MWLRKPSGCYGALPQPVVGPPTLSGGWALMNVPAHPARCDDCSRRLEPWASIFSFAKEVGFPSRIVSNTFGDVCRIFRLKIRVCKLETLVDAATLYVALKSDLLPRVYALFGVRWARSRAHNVLKKQHIGKHCEEHRDLSTCRSIFQGRGSRE